MARNFAQEYKERMSGMRKKSRFAPIPVPKRTDFDDIDIFRQDLGFGSPFNPNSITDSESKKLRASFSDSYNEQPVASNFGLSENTIKNIFRLGEGKITGSDFIKNVLPKDRYMENAIENLDFIPESLKPSLLSGLSLGEAAEEVGLNKALKLSGLSEDMQSIVKEGLPSKEDLKKNVLPGIILRLPISEKYKESLLDGKMDKEEVARDVMNFIKLPEQIQNIALDKDPENMALDLFQERVNLPFDVSKNRYGNYDIKKEIDVGPGRLELERTMGRGNPVSTATYNVKDYQISPGFTASLQTKIDDQKRRNAELGLKYSRPDKQLSIDGRASFESGRGPAFNINFERKF
tara:strand:+ start:40 stop:1086 length:1047 start_codon:yes stop_codon:yes gene_type:complete